MNDDSTKSVGDVIGGALKTAVTNILPHALLWLLILFGVARTSELQDRKNWPAWVILVALFVAYIFGWQPLRRLIAQWRVPVASGRKISLVLARLDGDKDGNSLRETVREGIKKVFGEDIEIILWPEPLRLGEGRDSDDERRARDKAQKWLAAKKGDLFLWGRVKGGKTLSLRLTPASGEPTAAESYGLTPDTLDLPIKFVSDLGSAIAARVAVSATSSDRASGDALIPLLRNAAERLQPIVERLNPAFDADTRGSLLHSYALVRDRIGGLAETKDDLLIAADAFRAALKEWTRERAPDNWAMVQNNLGNTLRALAVHEDSTPRLQEGIAALRAALEEMTPERDLLRWAGAHFNLGLALRSLDVREGGTAHIEEAITAFRDGLRESTRERVPPLLAALIRSNLGDALQTVGESKNELARVEEAVGVYREALKDWARDSGPKIWAGLQHELGTALGRLAEHEGGMARLEEAIDAFRAALAVFEQAADRDQIETSKANLELAEQSLAERQKQMAQ